MQDFIQIEIILKQVREKLKVSLEDLAKDTEIDRHYLSDIENHKVDADEILFSEMVIIAKSLEVEITELYTIKHLKIV